MINSKQIKRRKSIRSIVVLILAIVTVYPLVWMSASSFKYEIDIFKAKTLILTLIQMLMLGWIWKDPVLRF